jgi:quercetin dioxygenase-like cupin family protein
MLDDNGFKTAAIGLARSGALSLSFQKKRISIPSSSTNGAACVMLFEDEQGASNPWHMHEREDETFVVLEGRLRVWCGEDVFEVGKGDTAILPRGIPHRYEAIAPGTSRIWVQCTPGGFDGFFTDCDALPVMTPETIAPIAARYGLRLLG